MPMRPSLLFTTALSSFGFVWVVNPGLAADLGDAAVKTPAHASQPAVSGPNFNIATLGGEMNSPSPFSSYRDDLWGVTGSFTLPVANRFGLQIDGLGGTWGGDAFYGIGGHFFWRNPDVGLLGVYAGWTSLNRGSFPFLGAGSNVDVAQVGLEAEYFWNSLTVSALGGWEGGDVPNRFFDRIDLNYYATPNLKFSIGHRLESGINQLALGTEWLTPLNLGNQARLSLFAEGRIGEQDHNGAWVGLRVSFGKSNTLIDKNRRDDPGDPLPDTLTSIQTAVGDLDAANHAAKKASESTSTSTGTSTSTSTF